MLGNHSIKKDLIKNELDLAGITKDKLKITTIRLEGEDQPRVLFDIVKKISDMDKNIVKVDQKNKNGKFKMRILVKDMSKEEEKMVREYLANDERFSEKLIV